MGWDLHGVLARGLGDGNVDELTADDAGVPQ